MKFIRCVSLVSCIALLGGCATLDFLSLGVSGVSYIVTGKSLSDHMISAFKQEDCAMHRALQGEQACITRGQADEMITYVPAIKPQTTYSLQTNFTSDDNDFSLGDNAFTQEQRVTTNATFFGEDADKDLFKSGFSIHATAK